LLQTNTWLDYEVKSNYSIRVRTTDKGGLIFEKSFPIYVIDENEPPSDITLSANTINYNSNPDTIVGTFITTDQDEDETFVYEQIGGSNLFYIQDDQLRTSSFLAQSVGEYSVEVLFVL
jgi:hypothetical protein